MLLPRCCLLARRPYDARMWIAMGNCLEKLGKRAEAISTYERVSLRAANIFPLKIVVDADDSGMKAR